VSWKSGINFVLWTFALQSGLLTTEEKVKIWKDFISKLESEDCDVLHDCLGTYEEYDEAYYQLHPDEKR
jgi:hypothetical protein